MHVKICLLWRPDEIMFKNSRAFYDHMTTTLQELFQCKFELSTSQGHITDCTLDSMVYAGVWGCSCRELIWTCLVWREWSMSGNFSVPSHQLNSAPGERKGITQTIMLTPSQPVSCLTQWCQAPSCEAFMSLVWCGRGSNPGLLHAIPLGLRYITYYIGEVMDLQPPFHYRDHIVIMAAPKMYVSLFPISLIIFMLSWYSHGTTPLLFNISRLSPT